MFHKQTIVLALFSLFFLVNVSANKSVIRILAIGNSFSANAIEQNLYELAINNGDSLVIGNIYSPGCSVNQHWKNAQNNDSTYQYRKIIGGIKTNQINKTLLTCLEDEKWDYISFQQASYCSGKYDSFSNLPALMQYVAKHVNNPHAKFVFHMTWAYENNAKHNSFKDYNFDQLLMYHSIVSVTNRILSEINNNESNPNKIAFIIPVGTAIQYGRKSSIGDHFCNKDGYHLNNLGEYCAACVWLKAITGKNPTKKYKPIALTKKQINIAQHCARLAIRKPFSKLKAPKIN